MKIKILMLLDVLARFPPFPQKNLEMIWVVPRESIISPQPCLPRVKSSCMPVGSAPDRVSLP